MEMCYDEGNLPIMEMCSDERNLLIMEMCYDELEMMDFEHFSVYDRLTMEKWTRIEIMAGKLWEKWQNGAASGAMQSNGSSTSSLPPLPAAGPPPILEELLGPGLQAVDVLTGITEILVSMTVILAVGGFLGALGFAVNVLGPRVALAQLLGLTATAPALGTPNQDQSRRTRRRSRWEPPQCYLCSRREVSHFFSCCQDLVCYDCASGRGPAMCRCTSMRRTVPHRPQYSPLPRRTVRLLQHPIWQIYNISDEPNFIVIRYFRPEDATYSQETTGIRYTFHFFMEGAQWTRRISAWYTATPHAQEARVFLIEDSNPEGNNEAEPL